jgi:hypothetical protein
MCIFAFQNLHMIRFLEAKNIDRYTGHFTYKKLTTHDLPLIQYLETR